ncbi:MAG: hypothetical protein AAGL24_11155 [Pseudomonadota bacterium]
MAAAKGTGMRVKRSIGQSGASPAETWIAETFLSRSRIMVDRGAEYLATFALHKI